MLRRMLVACSSLSGWLEPAICLSKYFSRSARYIFCPSTVAAMSLPEGLRLHDVKRPTTKNTSAMVRTCLKPGLSRKISSVSRAS